MDLKKALHIPIMQGFFEQNFRVATYCFDSRRYLPQFYQTREF